MAECAASNVSIPRGFFERLVPLKRKIKRLKAEMRGKMQESLTKVRKSIREQKDSVSEAEAKQLKVLDVYALGVQTALSRDLERPHSIMLA